MLDDATGAVDEVGPGQRKSPLADSGHERWSCAEERIAQGQDPAGFGSVILTSWCRNFSARWVESSCDAQTFWSESTTIFRSLAVLQLPAQGVQVPHVPEPDDERQAVGGRADPEGDAGAVG